MSSIIDKSIYSKVLATIDIDALAKELAPEIRKEVKKGIIEHVQGIEWYELLGGDFDKLLAQIALDVVAKGFNGKKVTKHTKK